MSSGPRASASDLATTAPSVDADGDVVAADGEILDIPDNGSLPDLHGYMVCIRPERLTVTLHGTGG